MHLIVDGYNLLAGAGSLSGHLESARERLLHDLAAYRHRKNHLITVVFDGWQQGRPSEQREHRAGVQVIYSKRGERADQGATIDADASHVRRLCPRRRRRRDRT